MQIEQSDAQVQNRIESWMQAMVIDLNLCPFAAAVHRRQQVNIVVAESSLVPLCLQQLTDEADSLIEGDPQSTTLLVLPTGFDDFDDYLDLLAMGDALLEDLELDEDLQLASFHPDYQFDDTDFDDPSNWTNRSPYPILHLLTQDSVSKAVDSHPDIDSVPETNINKLEQMGTAALMELNRTGS